MKYLAHRLVKNGARAGAKVAFIDSSTRTNLHLAPPYTQSPNLRIPTPADLSQSSQPATQSQFRLTDISLNFHSEQTTPPFHTLDQKPAVGLHRFENLPPPLPGPSPTRKIPVLCYFGFMGRLRKTSFESSYTS